MDLIWISGCKITFGNSELFFRQGPVVELLSQRCAITDPEHAASELLAASAK